MFNKNTLFWKLSLILLLLLLALGASYIYLGSQSSQRYFEETSQRLNADVAAHGIKEITFFKDGEPDEAALGTMMHSMMAINPSVEVYLLNNDGIILKHVALHKVVKLKEVDLKPIKRFIASEGKEFIKGDDPRNPGLTKIFSTAKIEEAGEQLGYLYVILASQEYESVAADFYGPYIQQLGVRGLLLTLFTTFLIGSLLIWYLTRNLSQVIEKVQSFQNGNLAARVQVNSNDEFGMLGQAFNGMAGQIHENIENIKAVDHLRKELIANVSHDLRTPLSIIHGYAETLQIKPDLGTVDRNKYIDIILNATNKLKNLVSELFELSKLEAKQVKPKKEAFQFSLLVDEVFNKFQLLAEKKNITIERNWQQQGNQMVMGDISLIERVLQNLIDNALKYTPENGKIIIGLNAVGNQMELQVQNSGSIIPAEDIPHLFDRYYKGQRKNQDSTGLGLAIVKKILDLHESTIKVFSKLGEGTTFSFGLPRVL